MQSAPAVVLIELCRIEMEKMDMTGKITGGHVLIELCRIEITASTRRY